MAEFSRFRLWWLFHLSQPAHIRALYREVHNHPPQALLEAGNLSLTRTVLLLRLARQTRPDQPPRYVGIDAFEAEGKLSLKAAYQTLRPLSPQVALLPGTLRDVLPHWANRLAGIDLLLLWEPSRLRPDDPLWFYIPRMMSEQGRVLMECRQNRRQRWAVVSAAEAQRRAEAVIRRRAA